MTLSEQKLDALITLKADIYIIIMLQFTIYTNRLIIVYLPNYFHAFRVIITVCNNLCIVVAIYKSNIYAA